MWIKICGITSLEDAEIAVQAGADALGFVFAESSRRVSAEAAYKIIAKLPKPVEKIGVFVDGDFEEILSAIQMARLTGVQLHGANSVELVRKIRERADQVGLPLHILRVLGYEPGPRGLDFLLDDARTNGHSHTVLVDTRLTGKHGGTGIPFDWAGAREVFRTHVPHLRLIVAGGLNPDNVGEAIRTLRPWGVDVSSGVETVPGRKDHRRIVDFIRAACAAAVELNADNLTVPVY